MFEFQNYICAITSVVFFLLSACQRWQITTSLSKEIIAEPSIYPCSMRVKNREPCMKRCNGTPKIYWVRLVGDENGWTLFGESCDPCYVCCSRFGTAPLGLAVPNSLSFKPGHLSVASSTLMLAGAAVWVLPLAGSLPSTFWSLVLTPQVPSWA